MSSKGDFSKARKPNLGEQKEIDISKHKKRRKKLNRISKKSRAINRK